MVTNSPELPPRGTELQRALSDLHTRYDGLPAFVLVPLIARATLGSASHDNAVDWWAEAGREFRKRLDAETWPKGSPWAKRRTFGGIDYWHVNAFALDRLEKLLAILLPDGSRGVSESGSPAWIGWHLDRPITIAVDLLSGAWDELDTGYGGPDPISLVAHVAGLGQGTAARWLADWIGTRGRRHA